MVGCPARLNMGGHEFECGRNRRSPRVLESTTLWTERGLRPQLAIKHERIVRAYCNLMRATPATQNGRRKPRKTGKSEVLGCGGFVARW